MDGKVNVYLNSQKLSYVLDLHRKVTVVIGDSATGKTVLHDFILERSPDKDGNTPTVQVSNGRPIIAITQGNWQMEIETYKDCVFVVDENLFVTTPEFAECVTKSDSYFILTTRFPLPGLSKTTNAKCKLEMVETYLNSRTEYTNLLVPVEFKFNSDILRIQHQLAEMLA